MNPYKYFSGHNVKKENKSMLEGWIIFTSGSVAYIKADFKKLVSDRFHTGSTLVESECIQRETRLSQQPRSVTVPSKPFHMEYRSTLQCTSLTLHCKYPIKNLNDQSKLEKKITDSTKL